MTNKKIIIPKQILLFFIFTLILCGIRIPLFESLSLVYIFWNIFLAFIAYMISSVIVLYQNEGKLTNLVFVISMIFWIIFIPNTFYLITDLIHIGDVYNVPILYDTFMLFGVAIVGLILGVYSISHIDKILIAKYSKKKASILIPIIIILTSFGVYLGRFLRFNSWNVFDSPLLLIKNLLNIFAHPIDNISAYGYTLLFFVFIYTSYYSLRSIIFKES